MPNECVYLDTESAESVKFSAFWRMFAPVTPYGERAKGKMQPFLPGAGAAFRSARSQLHTDAAWLTESTLAELQPMLRALPDVSDATNMLETPGTVLPARQLLLLKQFLFHGRLLADRFAAPVGAWTAPQPWHRLLAHFGDAAGATFAVDHVADAPYLAASEAFAAAMRAAASQLRDRDRQWYTETGRRPHRDGQLTLSLPDQDELAARLKQDPRVRWLRDTPFESVFEILPTSTEAEASEQEAACRQALDVATERLLHGLCDALRADLPLLKKLQEDVAQFDLRVARVAMLRGCDGCIPDLGEDVRLVDGVHPFVAERLGGGAAYVPLTIDPDSGANVLCGSNMGGKSVALCLLFACQVLAQYGLPVPARSFQTRLFRFARFCASAETDLQNGLSAFGREITRLTDVWDAHVTDGQGFICMDEPGRSTNPSEGEALVVGLLRTVQTRPQGSLWLIATHFPAVLQEAYVTKFRVRGVRDALLESASGLASELAPEEQADLDAASRVRSLAQAMDYRVERLQSQSAFSEALDVAAWLGLPDSLLEESRRAMAEGRQRGTGEPDD